MRLMDRFRAFMTGRYGSDQLNIALLIVYFVLSMIAAFTKWLPLMLVADIFIVLAVFRMFSRNVQKRYQENAALMKVWNRVKSECKLLRLRLKEGKTNRFFRCTNCGQIIRVPKGKGQIRITCPKCRHEFTERT